MTNLNKLKDKNEDVRRLEIITVSKEADANSVSTLLDIFHSETIANKRHIVRAFGNIGGSRVESKLLQLANSESGEILGDICRSLGQLKSEQAIPLMKKHRESDIDWVSQNATWALKQYAKDS